MNKTISPAATAIAGLLIAMSLLAHDPSEHKNDDAQPNCEAMKTMDHPKMDMNDPVMMAMMKKCMHSMHEKSGHMDMQEQHEKKRDKNP